MDSAGAVESKLPTAPWTTPERVAHTDHSADGHSRFVRGSDKGRRPTPDISTKRSSPTFVLVADTPEAREG